MFSATSFKSISFHPNSWKGVGVVVEPPEPPVIPPNLSAPLIGAKSRRKPRIQSKPIEVYALLTASSDSSVDITAELTTEAFIIVPYIAPIEEVYITSKSISTNLILGTIDFQEYLPVTLKVTTRTKVYANIIAVTPSYILHKSNMRTKEVLDILNLLL